MKAKVPMTKTKKRGVASVVTLVFVAIIFVIMRQLIISGVIDAYYSGIINLACINIIAAVSLNMVTGMLGQLVLGHAGFMLVGAYTAALFTLKMKELNWNLNQSLPIALVLGGLLAAVFGLIIGIPALRLRGDYLAIITLGFGEIIRVVANNLSITNGAKGLSGIPSFSSRQDPAGMFNYLFLIAVITIFVSYTFGTSRHGRAVRAIREDEIAAEASGVHTTYYKLLTFMMSAFFAGIAGGLYAHYLRLIDPAKFDFNRSVEILMMVVLGGMGSITGSVISAGVLSALPEMLRGFATYRMLIYSVVLILVMLFRPMGLLGRREIQVIGPFEKILKHLTKNDNITKKEKTAKKGKKL
ncbi:MAG: branched-chain amino acid ABC transporter permease [Oscillospiraceae bacterium]